MIKFLNLRENNLRFKTKILKEISSILDSGYYINSSQLFLFEKEFSQYLGAKYAVGVGNGFDALSLVLRAWKQDSLIKDNDEVLVQANTFIATINAILENNLKPVLIEPDEKTFNLDFDRLAKRLTKKTKIILPVHLYGQINGMGKILNFSKKNNLLVLEDAAQAHGAIFENKYAGTLGHAAAFSFYPGKNLGAIGDAGIITTNNKNLYSRLLSLRNYGFSKKNTTISFGVNSRLDEIQAAILRIKLKNLEEDNKKRKKIAKKYLDKIRNPLIELPYCENFESHVWHLFVIKTKNREKLRKYLLKKGIETSIHYPIPPHLQKGLKIKKVTLPITEKLSKMILSLPIDPNLREKDINKIIKDLNEFN